MVGGCLVVGGGRGGGICIVICMSNPTVGLRLGLGFDNLEKGSKPLCKIRRVSGICLDGFWKRSGKDLEGI